MHLFARLHTLLWLVGVSSLVFAGFRLWHLRLRLVYAGFYMLPRLHLILNGSQHARMRQALQERPQILGALVWPYIDCRWSAEDRLGTIAQHFADLDGPRRLLDFPESGSVEIARVPGVEDNIRLVLDKPMWFIREGQVTLNLFQGERRLYSLAFSIGREDGERVCYVGAIQGVTGDDIPETYKHLTKELHGMRPRDLLIETLRVCCEHMGVQQVLFVADQHRHHRAARYFGADKAQGMNEYDPIWADRGAVQRSDGFFSVSAKRQPRALDSIASKKRSMYRKRHELIDELFTDVVARIDGAMSGPAAHAPI